MRASSMHDHIAPGLPGGTCECPRLKPGLCDRVRHHPPRAFSLIELLVVLGIIAILLGILLPTITRVRLHAQQLQCMAKLRQVGYAFTMYANANQGRYPPYNNWEVYGNPGSGEDDDDQLGWCERMEQYLGKPTGGIYWCPSFPPETQFNYFMGAHWNAARGHECLLVTDVKRSSEFVLGGECTHQRLYPPPWGAAQTKFSTQDCDKDDVRWKCLSFFGEEYGFNAHPAGNNVLFGDGHVAPFKRFDPAYMTYDPQNVGVDWGDVTAAGG